MGRSPALLAVLCAAALLAAGCGSARTATTSATTSVGAATPTTMSTTTPTTMSTSTTTGGQPAVSTSSPPTSVAYSTTPVSVAGQGNTALLTAVRAGAQDGFDRITFEFANTLPGYAVEYGQRPVLQDGSGNEVVVDGAGVLAVRMTPASGFDLSGGGRPTYTGPDRIRTNTSTLVEVVQTGDFEGVLTWVAGVSTSAGFKVSTLASPPRLVVDVKKG